MNKRKKTILLKITGETLPRADQGLDGSILEKLAFQVKQLRATHRFGVVMGGGNFFRGARPGKITLSANVGHSVGMLATAMNGLIIQDIFQQSGISTHLFTASHGGTIGDELSPQNLDTALAEKECLIFAGGSGNPYITTDTTAVIRALQIGASEIWKGTNVNGIYSEDPRKNTLARLLPQVRYEDAVKNRYAVMDLTAFTLAEQYKVPLRVFNIFKDEALLQAAQDPSFGSTVF
ncbi:UMP kinase [Candidatus Dependentiae bacterium]|nr:UMP kinase [Candidatus Dependentiae bacterium]